MTDTENPLDLLENYVELPPKGPSNPPVLDGPWAPDLTDKQFEVLNDMHQFTLVSGPRMTGKSIAICHRIFSHLWNTNGAKVALFATSYKVATDGGSWTDMIEYAFPQWQGLQAGDSPGDDPNAELEYTTFVRGNEDGGPKLDAKSRTPFFRIRNRFGGESECRLFSIDNENEIEAKTKQLRLSAVWCIELSTFKTRKIFEQTIVLLRAHGVPDREMFWIADTNPPEEGEDHWAHRLFYVERTNPDHIDKAFQARLGLIEIFLDDNNKLSPIKRSNLENTYRDSPDEYDRYVLGKWPKSGSRRLEHFSDLLTPVHFPQGKLDVHRTSEIIDTGWDMGNVNSAYGIIDIPIIDGVPYVLALDEVVHTKTEISTADFTLECLDKMIALNEHYKKKWAPTFPGFKWRHWSDNSSLQFKANINDVDASIVYKVTNGQIELIGVEKGNNSVEDDVKLFRMLLREKRLFVGDNCPNFKKCLMELRRGSNKIIDPYDPLKHVFDAFRYAIKSSFCEYLTSPDKDPNSPKGRPALSQFSITHR